MGGVLAIAVLIGMVLGYWFVARPQTKKYHAASEYWVFLPGEAMPEQDAMMTQMISANPYSKRGQSPIGPAEGLIFSDVRLHIALVLRSKNQNAFRPDLFDAVETVTSAHLDALTEAKSFVKLRFVSEDRLKDKRHLQFLIHAADTAARLGGGQLIYDRSSQTLLLQSELEQELKSNFDSTIPALHVRTEWCPLSTGGKLETFGLTKVGVDELETLPMEADQRHIATAVFEEIIAKIWNEMSMPQPLEVEAYGDKFRVLLDRVQNRTASIRIMRVQAS